MAVRRDIFVDARIESVSFLVTLAQLSQTCSAVAK